MQRRTPVALGLAGAEDEQHLGPVQREQCARRPGAGVQRLERLDVLADPLRHLAAGERGLAEVDHRLVLVPLEGGDHQVAVVGADPHRVVEVRGVAGHAPRLERVPVSGNESPSTGTRRSMAIDPVIVSAADGPLPETVEQLKALRSQGATSVDVVLTHTDLVSDAELLELVELEPRLAQIMASRRRCRAAGSPAPSDRLPPPVTGRPMTEAPARPGRTGWRRGPRRRGHRGRRRRTALPRSRRAGRSRAAGRRRRHRPPPRRGRATVAGAVLEPGVERARARPVPRTGPARPAAGRAR